MPNNYISHLKICYYRKFKDRIDRNSLASTFKSNKNYIYYYFTLQLGTFVMFPCFTSKLKEKVGGLLGGGAKGYVAPPPLSNYWGAPPPWPPLFLRLCVEPCSFLCLCVQYCLLMFVNIKPPVCLISDIFNKL